MGNKYKYRLIILVISLLLITGLGISYAFWNSAKVVNIDEDNLFITAGTIAITYADGNSLINTGDIMIGWEGTKTFTVTNTSTASDETQKYNVVFVVTNNTFYDNSISFELTGTGDGSVSSTERFLKHGESEYASPSAIIAKGVVHNYSLKLKYNELSDREQNSEMGSKLSGYVTLSLISNITLLTCPTNSQILKSGEDIDTTGITIRVDYATGESEIINNGFDIEKANLSGEEIITYGGRNVFLDNEDCNIRVYPNITSTGATELEFVGNEWYLYLNETGTFTWNGGNLNVDVFMIGGGGNGGTASGDCSAYGCSCGGGGAGGYYIETTVTLARQNYDIVIGAATKSTTAFGLEAKGGASGSGTNAGVNSGTGAGANGGRGADGWTGGGSAGASGVRPFGDTNMKRYGAGGGGGACGAYTNYADGGGSGGAGGLDGGGAGGSAGQSWASNGSAATPNSGSGGGGGGRYYYGPNADLGLRSGGAGGSGVVIIRKHID